MLRLVRCDDGEHAAAQPRDVLPFPVGLARQGGGLTPTLPLDGGSLDAAHQVEQAMLEVEMNFLRLKRLFEPPEGPKPAA